MHRSQKMLICSELHIPLGLSAQYTSEMQKKNKETAKLGLME